MDTEVKSNTETAETSTETETNATSTTSTTDATTEKKVYQVEMDDLPKLIAAYHEDEIRQSELIIRNAIIMIWVGILLIIASFVCYATGITKELVLGTVAGSFIDIFSATILYLFNKTSKDKQGYFNKLSRMESYKKYMELIGSVKDENLKKEMIEKLIDNK